MGLKSKVSISARMKNVIKISGGTMLGQLVSLITLPLFTRIFGAAIMGEWALVTSVAIIVNTFSDIGLSNAIMIEEDEEETKKLFSAITTIVLFVSLIVGAFFGIYYFIVPSEANIKGNFYAIFVFIQIFTQQQIQLSYSWLNRKKEYGVLMKNPIINNVSVAVIAIPLGLLGFKTYGYYIGLIVGQLATLIHMRRNLPRVFLNFHVSDYKRLIKRHKEFCIYQMPANILSQIKNQLPVLLIRGFFGSEILGYYSVSVRVLNLPITFLANSVGKVFYQTIAEMRRKGQKIGEYTLRNINKAMKIAIIPMIALLSISDFVCSFVFGADYIVAGNITRIVAFNSFFVFLMMSTQGITVVLHKQKYTVISAVVQIIGYFIGLSIGKYVFGSVYVGCLLMTIIFSIAQVTYFSALFKASGVSPKRYIKDVLLSIGIIFAGAAVVRILTNLIGLTTGI